MKEPAPHPDGEPAPFRRIRFNTKYPAVTLDSLQKVELVEGSGDSDFFFLTYTANGKTHERYTDIAGLRQTERTAVLAFIGRYARTQAIRKKSKKRRKAVTASRRLATEIPPIDPADLIDLDKLIIEIPDPQGSETK